MPKIKEVRAREILDSRGVPTLEADVLLADGSFGRAAVPSGASTGEHEAVELRDGDKKRFLGKGVLKALKNVNKVLGPAVRGMDGADQVKLDEKMIEMDGTPNKGKLGANAILSVSMAASRAAALSRKKPLYRHLRDAFGIQDKEYYLPAPMFNIVNGGKHADSGIDVQEFMIVPVGAPSFPEALRMGSEVYWTLKKLLAKNGHSTAVGDEGGFAPRIPKHDDVLKTVLEAIEQAGYKDQVKLALDSAASEFFHDGSYRFEGGQRSAEDLAGVYEKWAKAYPIICYEDPLAEDDWDGWKAMTGKLGGRVRIVGDDIFVTNIERLDRGIKESTANAILIKLNQIGTVTETVRCVLKAHEAGFANVISHRSGETEDAYIADLAVALNTCAMKTGAPCRSERLCKYNQLLRIHDELGARALYAQDRAFQLGKVRA